MPAAIRLTVTAGAPLRPALPDLHRLACHLLEERAPGAHRAQRKAFSVWPLLPSPAGAPEALIRLNLLRDPGERERRAISRRLEGGLRLGDVPLSLRAVDWEDRPCAELAAAPPCRVADLAFRSPVYFSRSGRDYLLPDPELVVRGTVARWNDIMPPALGIGAEEARELGQRVVLFAHEIETARVEVHARSRRTGFLGWARIGLPRARQDGAGAAATLGRLVALLPYCGLGAQTTHGLGAVEVLQTRG